MITTVITIAVTVVVVALILGRSLRWQSVNLAKLTRLPLILAIVGVAIVAETVRSLGPDWHLTLVDTVVLGAELAIAALVGWGMGRLSELRTVEGAVRSRLSRTGAAVFLGFIALRIVVALATAHAGGTPALMSSSVMIIIATIKFTQGVVVRKAVTAHTAAHGDAAPVLAGDPTLSLR